MPALVSAFFGLVLFWATCPQEPCQGPNQSSPTGAVVFRLKLAAAALRRGSESGTERGSNAKTGCIAARRSAILFGYPGTFLRLQTQVNHADINFQD